MGDFYYNQPKLLTGKFLHSNTSQATHRKS